MKNTPSPSLPFIFPSLFAKKHCLGLVGAGPSFEDNPDYPTLRVVDLQVVGELTNYNAVDYDTYLNVRKQRNSHEMNHIYTYLVVRAQPCGTYVVVILFVGLSVLFIFCLFVRLRICVIFNVGDTVQRRGCVLSSHLFWAPVYGCRHAWARISQGFSYRRKEDPPMALLQRASRLLFRLACCCCRRRFVSSYIMF